MRSTKLFVCAGALRLTAATVVAVLVAGFLASAPATGAVGQAQAGLSAGQHSEPSSGGDPGGGIKVHGHWMIEVREPDGRLVSRHEFENALTPGGATLLARVLARQFNLGVWQVRLFGFPGPCTNGLGGQVECVTFQASWPGTPGAFEAKTLTLAVPDSGPNAGKLVLTGSVTAANASSLTTVLLAYGLCGATVATAACEAASFGSSFTEAALSPTVSVSAGQQVQITVVISFS